MPTSTRTNADSTTSTGTSQSNPRFLSLLLHVPKALGLTTAVLQDARVHWFPKLVFLGSLGTLLLALLFPESIADVLALVGIPGLGALFDLAGLPAEASLDWVALTVAAFNLLKLFPAEIVGEHYDRLFRRK
jgi:hypothetical protein